MKWKPFAEYNLSTHLPKEEVQKRIAENIRPQSWMNSFVSDSRAEKPYEGFIKDDLFKIKRVNNYRGNTLLPHFSGIISELSGATHIKMTVRPQLFWLIFTIVGLAVFIFFSLTWALRAYNNNGEMHGGIWLMVITPFAFIVIGYIITIVRFNKEINKAEEFFTGLLEAEAQPIITKPIV